jgi:ribosomal protein S18 acetylase RimI-like enzyme
VIRESLNQRGKELGVSLHQGKQELVGELEPLWLSLFDHQGPDDTWATGDRIGEVESLALLPGERGRGIGTLLLDCAEAILADRGARDVVIGVLAGNDGARRFYERRGMAPAIIKMMRIGPKPAGPAWPDHPVVARDVPASRPTRRP